MPIFTAATTAVLATAGITSTFVDEAEIVELDPRPEDDGGEDE